MAENLGGYEVSVELKDKITQAAEKAEKSIQNIAQSTEYAQKKMEGLVSAISALGRTKGNDDAVFSKSEADRINKAIVKAVANMERLKGLVSQRASIGLDTSEAQRRIEQVEALIKKFYAGDGSIRSKHQLQGILESTDVVKFSKDFDYFVRMQDRAATAAEKAAERIIRSKQKEQEALDRAAERETTRQAQRDNRAWTQGTSRADLERSTLFSATLKRQMEEELRREQAQLQVAMQTHSHRTMTTAERNSFKVFYAEQEREAQAAEKALDSLASKNSKVTREVTSLNEKLRNLEQTSGKMRDLGMDTTRLMQARDELRKIVDLYNLLNGKGSTRRDFLEADASKVKALEQYRTALAAAERELKRFNETQKMGVKRDNQIDTLEKQIKQLEATLAKANTKQYKPGIDTSNIEAAKQQIRDLIAHYRQMAQALQNGGALYSKRELSGGKSEALQNLSVAQAQANAESKKAVQAAREQEKANKQAEEATRRNAQQIKQIAQQYRNLESAAKGANSTVGQLKNLLWQFAPLYGMQQLVMSVIQVGGEIEKQHIALRSIIGDLQDADELFGQIKGLALSSPFTFGELNRDVKQLAAFGVEADDLYDTTKRLADISSGLGVSFERLGLAYGQVKARSWLDGKELRQFAYAGVPLLQKLADMYTKQGDHAYSTGEVRQMVFKRQVSFEDVQQVLWDMTNKGGQFYNMQETLSQTLYGRYNKLVDAWEIMLSEFAKGDSVVGGTMKNILNFITNIILGFNKAAGVVTAFFATFALRKVGAWMYNNALGGKSAANMQKVLQEQYRQAVINNQTVAGQMKLTVLDKQLLASKGAITKEMIHQLQVEQGLSSIEAKRVFYASQIRQGYQKGLLSGGLGMFANGLGGSLMQGAKSLGSGMLNFFGGWIGVATTAAFVGYAMWEKRQAEIKRITDATAESIKDRYNRLSEFLQAHPLKVGLTGTDFKNEMEDLLAEYKEMTGKEFVGIVGDNDQQKRMTMLHDELELLHQAQAEAEKYKDVFANNRGDVEDALKDYQEAYTAWQAHQNDKNPIGYLGDYMSAYRDLEHEVEDVAKKVMNKLRNVPADMREQVYHIERDAFLSTFEGADQNSVEIAKRLFDAKAGFDAVDDFARQIIQRLTNQQKQEIIKQYRRGSEISDIANGIGKETIQAAMEGMKTELPHLKDDIQKYFDDNPLRWNIIQQIINQSRVNELTQTMTERLHKNKNWGDLYGNAENDIQRHTEGGNYTDLEKAAKADLQNAEKEYKLIEQSLRKGKEQYTQAQKEAAKANFEKFHYLYYDVYGFTDDDKKGRGGNRVPRDFELDGLKKRWDAIEKLIALWKKYRDLYGAIEATKRVTRKAEQEGITDIKNWADEVGVRQKIADEAKALIGKGRKEWQEARKATWQVKETNVETAQYDKEKRVVDALTKSYQEFVQQLKAQYELRDQLRKKFGKNVARDLADNVTTYTDTEGKKIISLGERLVDDLEKRLRSRLAEVNKRDNKDYTLEWAIQQKEDVIVDSFSKDGDIQSMIKDLRQARMDLEKEAVNTVSATLEKIDTLTAKTTALASEYNHNRRSIMQLPNTPAREKALSALNSQYLIELWKNSKQYIELTKTPLTAATEEAERFKKYFTKILADAFEKGDISAEKYKEEIEKINEAFDKANISNIEKFYGKDVNGTLNKLSSYFTQRRDSALRSAESATHPDIKSGLIKEAGQFGNAAQMASQAMQMVAVIDMIVHAINDAVQGLKKLFDNINEVAEAFGNHEFANSGGYTFVSAFSAASQEATNAWDSAKNGDAMGALAGVVGSWTKWWSTFAKAHDARREQEIQEAKRQLQVLQNIEKNTKRAFEDRIGKVYADPTYYNTSLRTMQAQLSQYQTMLNSEADKKDSDASKLEEYKQNITDIEYEIHKLARTLAETLYDINFESYADSLSNSLVDAWAAGTNSVKAYREAVNDSLKDVAQNVVKQKVLGTWLDNEIDEWYRHFEDNKGVMDDMLYNHLAVIFRKLQERTELVNSAMDSMEEVANLYGYSMKDKKASSLSSAIAGVTEDTADLLASYMNAIRADVSLNRGYLQRLMEEVMPTISSTANLSLIELRGIKTTLDGISASIDRMDERMDDVVYGRKNLSVTVRNVA